MTSSMPAGMPFPRVTGVSVRPPYGLHLTFADGTSGELDGSLWLEREPDGLVLRYGHRGGDALPVEAAKVKAARCLEQGAARDLLASARFDPRQVTFAGRCDAASAHLDGAGSLGKHGDPHNHPTIEGLPPTCTTAV